MAHKNKINRQKRIAPYLFLLPNLSIFIVFIVAPALYGVYYSFTDYDGLNKAKFIGLENYIEIFGDMKFWLIFKQTGIYAAIVVPGIFLFALGVALLLIQKIKFKPVFRAAIYWPTMISFVVVGVTWKWIFGDSFGVLNYLIELMGREGIPWLTDPFFARMTVVIATLWCRVGFYMVIFMAGLQNIPLQYYEAARIDGATKVLAFRYITLPLLKPTSVMVIMLCIIDSFKAYPLIVSLTGGGPGKTTTYLVQYIYRYGFEKSKLGYASAMSVLLFAVIAIITAIQFRSKKEDM